MKIILNNTIAGVGRRGEEVNVTKSVGEMLVRKGQATSRDSEPDPEPATEMVTPDPLAELSE